MKVCHLTCVHNRYDGRIFLKECISLQNAGHEVSLVVADGKPDEVKNGIKIYGVSGCSNRLYRMIKTTQKVYHKAVMLGANVYHLHDPELLPIGIKLKKRRKIVIFDSHEDIPRQILDKKWIPCFLRRIFSTIYCRYESKFLKKINALITVNQIISNRLKQVNANLEIVSNFPIVANIKKNNAKYYNRTICFAGGIVDDYNIHLILKAIEEIDDVKFILAGYCDQKYLNRLKRMTAWSKVDYRGLVSINDVYDIYNTSSIGLAIHSYTANVGYKEGSLGIVKCFEYMAHELPIICTNFAVWKQIIDEEKCGMCVNPSDVNAIRDAIGFLLDNSETAHTMGENGRSTVQKKYNWATQENILINFYNQLL
jgi:glycosyltransferase involved in cell wall biosynthesis